MNAFKQRLVGTSLGRWGVVARDTVSLLRAPRVELGMIANDQLALRMLVGLCREGDTFVDVGAHIGSVVAEVRRHCAKANIVAFEAIPEKVAVLRRKFPGVAIHSCALSDRDGEAVFYVDDRESGYSSLAERPGHAIKVPMRRVDDLLEDAELIKIDVEGAELGVLRGAEKLIERCKPVIMFESGPGDVLGYTKQAMFDWFAARDYGLMAPNRLANTGGSMSAEGFLDSHEYPRRTTNYFAIPMSRFDEFRQRAKQVN